MSAILTLLEQVNSTLVSLPYGTVDTDLTLYAGQFAENYQFLYGDNSVAGTGFACLTPFARDLGSILGNFTAAVHSQSVLNGCTNSNGTSPLI